MLEFTSQIRKRALCVLLSGVACLLCSTAAFPPHLAPQRLQKFTSLSAKQKRHAVSGHPEDSTEMPANLRRKVSAKRPALGHVVPKRYRAGGSAAPKLTAQGKARGAAQNNPNLLKIAGGSVRGRKLDSPRTVYLRPMMGKVKEAVYSTFTAFGLYEHAVRHLDIFAGSGSVGLESQSRGATHCTYVDWSEDCCATIRRNLETLQFDGTVIQSDALTALREPEGTGIKGTFGIVTICPPYEEVVYGDLLEAVIGSPVIQEDTVVLVEYPVELGCLPHVVSAGGNTAVGLRNRRYGRTVIAMYAVNPTGKLSDAATSRPEEFVRIT